MEFTSFEEFLKTLVTEELLDAYEADLLVRELIEGEDEEGEEEEDEE